MREPHVPSIEALVLEAARKAHVAAIGTPQESQRYAEFRQLVTLVSMRRQGEAR